MDSGDGLLWQPGSQGWVTSQTGHFKMFVVTEGANRAATKSCPKTQRQELQTTGTGDRCSSGVVTVMMRGLHPAETGL